MTSYGQYAEFYDLLYADKDYRGESCFVSRLLERFVPKPPQETRVLDLACGTGKHAFELNELGYAVEGSDVSEKMIEQARRAAANRRQTIRFHNLSFQQCDQLAGSFDAVTSMFAAVNYLTRLEDLTAALRNISGLLEPRGVFVFDHWNGHAVVRHYSPVKVLRKKSGEKEVIRISETSVDALGQRATVRFTCLGLENNHKRYEFQETHELRFFYPAELECILTLHGFEVIYSSPFMVPDAPVGLDDWNISVVARKRR